jgi:hypothetical protein
VILKTCHVITVGCSSCHKNIMIYSLICSTFDQSSPTVRIKAMALVSYTKVQRMYCIAETARLSRHHLNNTAPTVHELSLPSEAPALLFFLLCFGPMVSPSPFYIFVPQRNGSVFPVPERVLTCCLSRTPQPLPKQKELNLKALVLEQAMH